MLRAVVDLVRDGIRMNLVLVRWGRDVQASQSLIEELDLGHIVRWIEPLRKQELWSQYLKSHAVLDQFLLPAFGGITFEALALGRRVITSLDMKAARRFFGEAPPILVASGVEEIAAAMRVVAADSEDHKGRGALAADWVRRYHSAERIVGLQLNAYQALLEENDVNMSHEDHLRRVRCAPKV
jgi:glycosyltransferase involved in cell wall biosynthesis